MPVAPPAWAGVLSQISVQWDPGEGAVRSVTVPVGQSSVSIELLKTPFTPVLAYPLPGWEGSALLPAGGVFPCTLNASGELELTWMDGAGAFILSRLRSAGGSTDHLNVPRLIEELRVRSGGDPWSVDLDRIVEALGAGTFRADWIRCRDLFPVRLQVRPEWLSAGPAPELVSGNALHPLMRVNTALISEDAVALDFGFLPVGVNRFLQLETGYGIDICVAASGTVTWFSTGFD